MDRSEKGCSKKDNIHQIFEGKRYLTGVNKRYDGLNALNEKAFDIFGLKNEALSGFFACIIGGLYTAKGGKGGAAIHSPVSPVRSFLW